MAIPIAVASNRGPVTFARRADGTIAPKGGVGGLVRVIGGALRGRSAVWVAATITDEDRETVARDGGRTTVQLGGAPVAVRLVALDPEHQDRYYNQFSNRILWFLHHYVGDLARTPAFGAAEAAAWESYRLVNRRFAEVLAEDTAVGGVALPQDYHLALVPGMLREMRADLRVAQFWHIPFCQPDHYRTLPDAWGAELLEGMLAADLIGFQSARWAGNFLACCREVLGARVAGRTVRHRGHVARVGVYPVGVDPSHLAGELGRPKTVREAEDLERTLGDRRLVLRVDRVEPTKNVVRGLSAFERLLERRPELRGRVVQLALLTPSRDKVPEYRAYLAACRQRAKDINARFGTADWTPVMLEVEDNFPRVVAAYRRYDVLVVNSVYDGMNLIAREGPLVNARNGVVVLSRNAGAAAELAPAVVEINPFDVEQTADAIGRALDMPADVRARTAKRLTELAPGIPPERWLDQQLRDLARP